VTASLGPRLAVDDERGGERSPERTLETRIDRRVSRLDADGRTAAAGDDIEACPECRRPHDAAERVAFVELAPRTVKCLRCGAVVRPVDPAERTDRVSDGACGDRRPS
jgi:hypothetical protein